MHPGCSLSGGDTVVDAAKHIIVSLLLLVVHAGLVFLDAGLDRCVPACCHVSHACRKRSSGLPRLASSSK